MNDLRGTFDRKPVILLFSFLALLMLVGSVWDYPFSQAVYNQQNLFGIFFAAFGEMPASLGLAASGIMLILGRNKDRKLVAAFQAAAGILLLALGGAMAVYMPSRYIENAAVAYIAGVLFLCAALFLTVTICKSAEREMLIKVAFAIFLVVFLEMVLVNIIKIPWGRPRMRMISETPEAYFSSWWVIGSELKNKLVPMGIASEEFKSFPSGHTANGAALMLLPLFSLLSAKLKSKSMMLFLIGVVWGLLVALSRVIIGAHFITDTVVGFSITYIIILVVVHFVFFRTKKA